MGHGNNWGAVMEAASERVEEVLGWATSSPDVGVVLTPEDEGGSRVILALGNHGGGLGVLALCDYRSNSEGPELNSMFPFAFEGAILRFRFDRATEWEDPIEAELHGSLLQPPIMLSFFDGAYARFRRDYRAGEEYDVRLAILAYQIGPGIDRPAQITDPDVIRQMRAGHSDAFDANGKENLEPITVHMKGASIFFPGIGEHPEVAEFMGTVQKVSEFDLLGERVFCSMVEVSKDGRSLVLPVYSTRHGQGDGWIPRKGDWVEGIGWVHGYRIGGFDDLDG